MTTSVWQKQRTEHDMKEAGRVPIPGVSFLRSESDTHKADVKLTAISGPMKGTVVELKLELPRDYPLSPPAVRVCSDFKHPNVYGSYLCLDMLRSTGFAAPYAGWTPAYSLHALLFQLSTFLLYDTKIDQDYGGSVDRVEYVERQKNRDKMDAIVSSSLVNHHDADRKSENETSEESLPDVPQPHKGFADDSAPSLVQQMEEYIDIEAGGDVSQKHVLQRMEASLDLGSIEIVMETMTPDVLQKTLRLHPDGQVGHCALRRLNAVNGKQCFCTKKSPEDRDTVMGIGVLALYFKDGNLKSVSPSMSLLSKEAVVAGVRRDVWNQSRLSHFIPLIINRRHAPKALAAIPTAVNDIVGCAQCDTPSALLKVIGMAMTTLAAEMMTTNYVDVTAVNVSSRYVSDAAMETFLHLHHLLVAYTVEHPEVAKLARNVVLNFVNNPVMRHKSRCPNLGLLFAYMLLVPEDVVSWEALAPPLLRETLARNVLHATKGRDGTKFVTHMKDSPAARSEMHFRSAHVGLKIMALQAWFGNALVRPRTDSDAANAFVRIRNDYDTFSGQPSLETLDMFYRRFREVCAISNWKQFLSAVHLNIGVRNGETPIDKWSAVLKQAIRDSKDAGYHQQPLTYSAVPVYEQWHPEAMPVKVATGVPW
jgi:ubiquitin-protein ligase